MRTRLLADIFRVWQTGWTERIYRGSLRRTFNIGFTLMQIVEGLEGGCFCRSVRYRLNATPMFTHCCHCRECQNRTGSAFVVNAIIETDRIELLVGEPSALRVPTSSGRPHDIYRCPRCEIALWSDYGARPWLRFVRVGTLDDPQTIQPDVHIFARTKLPWVRLSNEAVVVDEYYDMEALWPKESLARRQRVSRQAEVR